MVVVLSFSTIISNSNLSDGNKPAVADPGGGGEIG